MQTPAQQIEYFRNKYSSLEEFTYNDKLVRVVAYIAYTNKKGIENYVFKLSDKTIIKVDT